MTPTRSHVAPAEDGRAPVGGSATGGKPGGMPGGGAAGGASGGGAAGGGAAGGAAGGGHVFTLAAAACLRSDVSRGGAGRLVDSRLLKVELPAGKELWYYIELL